MSLSDTEVKKIAHLARLAITEQDIPLYARNISNILDFVKQMSAIETSHITPMAHPMDAIQRLRSDIVTEPDQRELFQSLAPQVTAGLYLVPQVIAEEE